MAMTDRDTFAAAALTGLIACMKDETCAEICCCSSVARKPSRQAPPAESLPRLTDEEIEAIEYMATMHSVDNHQICRRQAEVLDALLRRLGARTAE